MKHKEKDMINVKRKYKVHDVNDVNDNSKILYKKGYICENDKKGGSIRNNNKTDSKKTDNKNDNKNDNKEMIIKMIIKN